MITLLCKYKLKCQSFKTIFLGNEAIQTKIKVNHHWSYNLRIIFCSRCYWSRVCSTYNLQQQHVCTRLVYWGWNSIEFFEMLGLPLNFLFFVLLLSHRTSSKQSWQTLSSLNTKSTRFTVCLPIIAIFSLMELHLTWRDLTSKANVRAL